MFDTLDNAAERHARRLDRERKLQLMEDAANASQRYLDEAHGGGHDDHNMVMNDAGSYHSGEERDLSPAPARGRGQGQAFLSTGGHHDDVEYHDDTVDYVETGGRGFGTGALHNGYRRAAVWCTPKKWTVFGAACALAVIIGVGVGASKNKGGGGMAGALGMGGASSDEPATEVNVVDDLTAAERFRAIRDRIILADVSDEESLQDLSAAEGGDIPTPQYLAADWLASKDPLQLSPSDPYLMDRYALAVFWYATHEAARREDEADPPSDDDEEYANWDRHDNWMTGTGICAWYGIQCHHREGTDLKDTRYDDNGKVTYFNVTSNDVRGPLPPEFFRVMTDMRHLNLSNNSITGTLPDLFREWTNLEDFFLNSNYIEGSLPQSLMSGRHADMLKNLDLGNNWLEGPVPSDLGNLRALRRLSLYENEFTGNIPASIGQCSDLRDLYFDANQLTGPVPEQLYQLTKLTDLRLRHNKLTGTLSESIFHLADLEILYMDTNEFTGQIPFRLDDVPHLEEIHLYNNRLTGTLPPELNELHHLKVLYLDTNRLTGAIPNEWAAFLHDLRQLFLYDNELTGELPRAMGRMEDLVDLRLNGNKFSGTIPESLGTLFHLEHVALENNAFEGGVPESLGQLEKLQALKLHRNNLHGTVPPAVCSLTTELGALEVLTGDCLGSPADLTCECCTQCFGSGDGSGGQ